MICSWSILGDPGAARWDDGIFTGESLQQGRESPREFTLTERVPEAFEIPLADWPESFSPVKIPSPQLAAPGSPRMPMVTK